MKQADRGPENTSLDAPVGMPIGISQPPVPQSAARRGRKQLSVYVPSETIPKEWRRFMERHSPNDS
jgi:hypothetical protein